MRSAVVAIGVLAGASSALAQEGLSLEEVAEQQEAQTASGVDVAQGWLADRRYEKAAVAAYEVLGRSQDPAEIDQATYVLAKSLYRLELFHGALHYFSRLLEGGPQSRFFAPSLEWCLFISRQMIDDASVNEVVARYGTADLPDEYRDEFLFRLARYHYTRALAIETGRIAGRTGSTEVVETKAGGLSFSGDIFGGNAPQPKVKKKRGGGLSIGGDLFGGGKADPSPASEGGELSATAHLAEAEKYSLRVNEGSVYAARAKFVEALVLHMREAPNQALSRFKDVVRLSREDSPHPDAQLKELAFFQLARTHFGAQQPSFSIFYYDRVGRDSYEWLDSLYEESWAHFRLGAYEKTLGNLLTLHAPFFEDAYFPESRILEAVTYYENCRYEEAEQILDQFMRRYEPVLKELQSMVSDERSPAEYFQLLDGLRNDDLLAEQRADPEILSQILELALADRRLARLDASQAEMKAEIARLTETSPLYAGGLGEEVEAILTDKRTQRLDEAGEAVQTRLREEAEHIKELVQQAIRIGVETARGEQERIESRLRSVDSGPKNVKQRFVEWTDDEKLVWPFSGEYWRDELGTYELTLARSCR
jgi:hypothetical protein